MSVNVTWGCRRGEILEISFGRGEVAFVFRRVFVISSEIQHANLKVRPLGKGKTSTKHHFSGSMLILWGVSFD